MSSTYTSISDLVGSPKILGQTVDMIIATQNPLINSGVAVRGPAVDALANGGANVASLPFIKPLDSTKFNISTDNALVNGETDKMTAAQFAAVRHNINNGYAYADLVNMLTAYDTKGGIAGALGQYWNEVAETLAVTSVKGAIASRTALTSSSSDAFSLDLVIDACATAGINRKRFRNIFVSPLTAAKMDKAQAIATVTGSDVNLGYKVWAGFNVIETESVEDDEIILAASGAVAFGSVPGLVPLEIQRNAAGGHGGGAETLWTRRSIVAHPQGFKYVPVNGEEVAADARDMADATRWAAAVDDKMIPFRRVAFDQP